MRVLFLILIIFALTTTAQTPAVNREFETAMKLARAQQFERAIEKYQMTMLLAENESASGEFFARIHFNLGVCYYQTKNLPEAVAEFNEAVKLSRETYQKAFYALGMAQKDLKNWRRAEAALRKAVKLKPNDGEAWFDLALVFLQEKDFDAAEKAFQKSIEYKSIASADAHNNLGVIFALRHEFVSAENEFVAALDASGGKLILARNNLQFCRLYQQRNDQNLLAKLEFGKF